MSFSEWGKSIWILIAGCWLLIGIFHPSMWVFVAFALFLGVTFCSKAYARWRTKRPL